jgi:hypoxanthine phosphoribosyltransferase
MRLVVQDGCPDALIGIKTGGLHVAQAMAKAAGYTVPVLSLTCRRPSTRYKAKVAALKKLITRLPRPLVDRLRVVEHALLTHKPRSIERDDFQFDSEELAVLDEWLDHAGQRPSLVVVDDAIDTGATLSRVLDVVSRYAPPTAKIRSAVITVTTPKPWALPRYTLYRQQLCRFPWSLDA